MKAYQLLFDKLIDINPRTGMIKFNGKRMTLVSVEALGILRRDLVNTLGSARAKGFLMRYGWACGFKDGETIEKMYQWDSKRELLLAGPYLHTLEGTATVEPDIIEFDEKSLHFTGQWGNSFEVIEHINYFGKSKDPICWILVGYASGYLTKTFGEKVVVYEEACEGKGDPHCRFVAKTVDSNDEHQQKDLRYYESETLLSELDRAYKEVQELNENIIESESVQKQLTDMLLEDKDIFDTVKVMAETLQKSIIIDYFHDKVEGFFIKNCDQLLYNKWKNNKELSKEYEDNIEIFPIRAHDMTLGQMIVIANKKLDKKERMIIQRSLMVCTVQIFHQRKLLKSIWEKKEYFFEEILNNKYNQNTLQRYMNVFDFNPNVPNRILTLKVYPESKKEEVLQYLISAYPNIDIFLKDNYIIMIFSEGKILGVEEFSKNIHSDIQNKFKHAKIYISLGRVAKNLKDLAKSYQDACHICDFIQLTYPTGSRVTYFEELEPVIMLLKGGNQEEMVDFCQNTIGKLVEYDRFNQGNLVITLKSYLDFNGNLQQTADDLHLSIAGLRYRLEKIESFCQADLKTGAGRFKYQLAIGVYFALQIINENFSFESWKAL
jgi:PucR family transcriptional regulator, purine catabolism regulatory protein